MAGGEKLKTPLVIFIIALTVVLFACASPAAAIDMTIDAGVTYTVASGVTLTITSDDTLVINSGGKLIINNNGVIDNYGTIYNCVPSTITTPTTTMATLTTMKAVYLVVLFRKMTSLTFPIPAHSAVRVRRCPHSHPLASSH